MMTDDIEVSLTDMAFNGPAIGRLDGQVVFADFGIPGERVKVAVERRKRDYLNGRVVEPIDRSADRVTPGCRYFGRCGGCQWQHIAYDRQVAMKTKLVADQFRRIAKLSDAPVRDTIPSPNPWHYRNHTRFAVNESGDLGFYLRGTNQFLRVSECPISDQRINDVLSAAQGKCSGVKALDVRVGVATADLLVQPAVVLAGQAFSTGQDSLQETLLGVQFQVSHDSFFQSNTPIAETLVSLVEDAMSLTGSEEIIDAYAGVGTFAVFLAKNCAHVIAVEESQSAIDDAAVNLAASGITNVELRRGRVEDVLPEIPHSVDAVLVDPPRAGCDRRVLVDLLERQPKRIVYVSCDPATLARDVRVLVDGGYTLDWVQPVDQFPQTFHIESVVRLSRQ